MSLTEQEARKKWCPFVHSTHTDLRRGFWSQVRDGADYGDTSTDAPNAPCIASECMAWRWEPQQYKHRRAAGEWIDTCQSDGYGDEGKPLPHVGHCGLAGKP